MWTVYAPPHIIKRIPQVNDCMVDGIVVCRRQFSRRKKSEIPSLVTRKIMKKRLVDDVVGEEEYMPTKDVGIPIVVRQVDYEHMITNIS